MAKAAKEEAEADYAKMGRQLAGLYAAVNPNRRALYRSNFLSGMFGGVGGAIGATIVIALIIWILSLVGHVPLIGHFVTVVRQTLQKSPVK